MSLLIHEKDRPEDERYILSVDSADRLGTPIPGSARVQKPSQSQYFINLPHEYRRIRRISLLSAEFPNTQYTITTANNNFVSSQGAGAATSRRLPEGTYISGAEFASALDALFTGGFLTFSYNANTRKITITNTHPVDAITLRLNAATQPAGPDFFVDLIWNALGYVDLTTNVTIPSLGSVEVEDTINIAPDRYVIMEVTFPRIMQGAMRTTGEHHQSFAKIVFTDPDEATRESIGNIYDFISAPVVFQKVTRLTHIGFRFLRSNGELYDFHNHDHSFTLEVMCE